MATLRFSVPNTNSTQAMLEYKYLSRMQMCAFDFEGATWVQCWLLFPVRLTTRCRLPRGRDAPALPVN